MEHLRLSGAYWGLTTLDLLGQLDAVDADEVISWIMKCQHESGFKNEFLCSSAHFISATLLLLLFLLFDDSF